MDNILEMTQVIMEPTRNKVIHSLLNSPKYIGQMAQDTSMDRSTVAYHLNILEGKNLVNSEYKILVEPKSKGTAVRVYSMNIEYYLEILKGIEELLPNLRPSKQS